MKGLFQKLTSALFKNIPPHEAWTLQLEAEDTQFIRLNQRRVRQIGLVSDATALITLIVDLAEGKKTANRILTLSGSMEEIQSALSQAMTELREEVPSLPLDPYAVIPNSSESSSVEHQGELLSPEQATKHLTQAIPDQTPIDLAGIYSSGKIIRANATTAGAFHWFQTESFCLDYSLYTPSQKALKNLYGGNVWNHSRYQKQIQEDHRFLDLLEKPSREIPRGEYRVYLGPQAVYEILSLLTWDALSESAIRQQDSPLRLLRSGEKKFSPLFHLSEDFTIGAGPRFNEDGSLAPETSALIVAGELIQTLISPRTAAEYQLKANGADDSESLRSPVIHAGQPATGAIQSNEILQRLNTGLYLSNLHYLNWSDSYRGRITGMTRYACFWVEQGEICAPIHDLRFDESIFEIFGSSLEALTEESWLIPSTSTYGSRSVGGSKIPGILLKKMKFTL